jgi:hypothetical protein
MSVITADSFSSLARCLDVGSVPAALCAAEIFCIVAESSNDRQRSELVQAGLPAMVRRLKAKRFEIIGVTVTLLGVFENLACTKNDYFTHPWDFTPEEGARGHWAEAVAAGVPDALVAVIADAAAGAWAAPGNWSIIYHQVMGTSAERALKAILKARQDAEAAGPLLAPRSLKSLRRLAAGEVDVEIGWEEKFYVDMAKRILDDLK